ncbi:alpha/beta fold hydrolase [Nocardia sp. SYP-A9097]|uniref:alpha/beta hydrolase n=1 Tax=Nocardia sp. SYP-A9097 TaxID=2663237 RepID=UPI00129BA98A|nr:alpha/beta hydrolase [Nocardia sp. SYP-A9097]MRH93263.1 alpha/beta fold hydrolase [Nocardia sp. SYP-A9097]
MSSPGTTSASPQATGEWRPDELGSDYQQRTLPLGPDPDGEGDVVATLIRYTPASQPAATSAVLYVHGFTDYFFQEHLSQHMAAQGFAFYALDLRKCGRSTRAGQTPHYVSDLALYDQELNRSLRIIREETGLPVLIMGHSTGGLVTPLWLNRVHAAGGARAQGISGLVLNSPWFDLQGPAYYRHPVSNALLQGIGRLSAMTALPLGKISTYGDSLHHTASGEWDYNLDWKPLSGFAVHAGWLRAIRRGHARVHRGLDIGVPALVLRSKVTRFMSKYGPAADVADVVLDVKQIQRWSGCLGDRTNIVPIEGARHDVFLSAEQPRTQAFAELDSWLKWLAANPDSH